MATKQMPFEYGVRWAELGPMMDLSPEVVRLLDARDQELENFLSNQPIVWSRDASVTVFRSKPWTAKTYAKIRSWSIEIGQDDAGDDDVQASAVDVELHVDGVLAASLTLPAGASYIEYSGRLPSLGPGARVTIYSTDIGFDLISTVGF